MTTPGVDVIIEMVEKAAADGTAIKLGTEDTISKINLQVGAMMERFRGQAPVVFMEKYTDWQRQMGVLVAELERIINAAKASAAAQRQLEADSQAAIMNVG